MNNSVSMHVLKGFDNLKHEIFGLTSRQLFPLFDHFTESLIDAEFEYYIDIFLIFKNTIEFDYMTMMKSFMYFNFG